MIEITADLYIGDIHHAGKHDRYTTHRIQDVVTVTSADPEDGYPDEVRVHDHPMLDGPQNSLETMIEAVGKTWELLEADRTVLVHCQAASSRSPAVAAAGLAMHAGDEYSTCMSRVREQTPIHVHESVRDNARRALEALQESTERQRR